MLVEPHRESVIRPAHSWGQTIAAAVVTMLVFLLLISVGTPIVEALLEFFESIFAPNHLHGGLEVNDPGLLNLNFRAMLVSGLSAIGGFVASLLMFHRARHRVVAGLFALAVAAWGGVLIFVGVSAGAAPTTMFISTGLMTIPALGVACLLAARGDI